jgi:hypothetical protein
MQDQRLTSTEQQLPAFSYVLETQRKEMKAVTWAQPRMAVGLTTCSQSELESLRFIWQKYNIRVKETHV